MSFSRIDANRLGGMHQSISIKRRRRTGKFAGDLARLAFRQRDISVVSKMGTFLLCYDSEVGGWCSEGAAIVLGLRFPERHPSSQDSSPACIVPRAVDGRFSAANLPSPRACR